MLELSLGQFIEEFPVFVIRSTVDPLNNADLTYLGPLIHEYFSVVNNTVLQFTIG